MGGPAPFHPGVTDGSSADAAARMRLRGRLGWIAWLVLHLVQLIGFRNRAIVLLNWAWNDFTYERGARLIVRVLEPEPEASRPDV